MNFKLCDSAYKYRTYFFNNKPGMISECWITQGFKINNLDMNKQKIDFKRVEFKRKKVIIPKFMYNNNLHPEMIEEVNKFFLHLKEKYRLR